MAHGGGNFGSLVIYLILTAISGSLACSFPPDGPFPPWFTMEQTFDMAPAVIYGTHKGQTTDPDKRGTNDTIEVHCIFKSGGFKIREYIYLDTIILTSCDITYMEEGKAYLIAIKETEDPDESDNNYAVFTPDLSHTAAFPANEDNVKAVVHMCALDDMVMDPDGIMNMYMCPMRKVTRENCSMPATFPPRPTTRTPNPTRITIIPTEPPFPSNSNVAQLSPLLATIFILATVI